MTGPLLVLTTWVSLSALVIVLGLPWARFVRSNGGGLVPAAMWIGLGVLTVLVLFVSLARPLSTPVLLWVLAGSVVLSLIGMRWQDVRSALESTHASSVSHASKGGALERWVLAAALALVIVYFSVAVLGPATNYDTGLYHLNAVYYAFDYGLIPGIANLFDPYGYNNALFPVAAALGNGPWQHEGFRLVNGLLVVLMAINLSLRFRERRPSPGSWVLLFGALAALVPLVAMADYWVASPTSDTAVFILTLVSVSYLVDVVFRSGDSSSNAAITFTTLLLACAMRPLMWLMLLLACAVLIWSWWRRREATRVNGRLVGFLGGASVLIVGLQTARDVVLSGWLQYPLAIWKFDVPWAAQDPIWSQLATLASARDPIDREGARAGYGWVGAWLARLPDQWEPYELLALAVAVLVSILLVRRHRPVRVSGGLVLVLVPSVITTVAWFLLTPPSFRFAWGPVFSLLVIPLGMLVHAMAPRLRSAALALTVTALLSVTAFTAVTRLDLPSSGTGSWSVGAFDLRYVVTPLPATPTLPRTTAGGVAVSTPLGTDQCWSTFPMCSPAAPDSLSYLKSSFFEGLKSDE